MADRYNNQYSQLDSPPIDGFPITPNDGTDFTQSTRYIYVGGAGAVTVKTIKGTNLTFAAVPTGTQLAIRASRVLSTGTTATNLLGLY